MSENHQRGIPAIVAALSLAAQEGRAALIPYLTVGYPTPGSTPELVRALIAGGADIIELGVPFSDPVADGPTIQAASYAALRQGVTPATCLQTVRALREEGVQTPILLMGYYNPILSFRHGLDAASGGPAAYAAACRASGVDGLIVPDLPPEEADELSGACHAEGLALVYLVAPTTGEARIAALCAATSGFLYVVRRLGTTGADAGGLDQRDALAASMATVRRHARTPVALGFGVSTPQQAAEAAALADGVIVGSAIVERADAGAAALRDYVAGLRAALVR
jgi:tryptophan synthase alpha chain